MAVAHAHGLNAGSRDTARDQQVTHLVGALLGQFQIGLVVTDGVRVPFNPDREFRFLHESRGEVPDDVLGLRRRRGAVAVEGDPRREDAFLF